MEVLFISDSWPGSEKVRVRLPKQALQLRGHRVGVTSLECFNPESRPDVAVFVRTFPVDVAPYVSRLRKMGSLIVYDTDDALDLALRNSQVHFKTRLLLESVFYLWENADLVTTSTERLAQHLRAHNPKVTVLPNCVDLSEWQEPVRHRQKCRIGYQGTATHLGDLLPILDVIRDLQKIYRFDFVIHGLAPSGNSLETWFRQRTNDSVVKRAALDFDKVLSKLMQKLSEISCTFSPYVPIEEHAPRLRNLELDIGLCPLNEGDFNSAKSCLKYYEYALSGCMTLASRVLPYTTELDLAYTPENTYDSWRSKLEFFIISAERREEALRHQAAWVRANRDIHSNIQKWEEAYEP